MRELQPGARGAADRRAGALGRARRPASRCCRARRRSTAGWTRCCRRSRRSPTTRSSRAASSNTTDAGATRCSRRSTTWRPTQTVCNYLTLWFRNISSLLSEGDRNGTWQRFIIVTTPQGPNNEGGPSSAPANGPTESNHLHTNPYPNTAAPGQPRECEAGNEPFLRRPDGDRPTSRARSRRGPRATRRTTSDGPPRTPHAQALERLHRADGALILAALVHVLRLHQGHPVHARLPGQGAVRVGELDPAQLAGADRGRRGRQGQGGRGRRGLQRRRAGAWSSTTPRCRCTRTRRPRSARASSSRATSSSTSSRARRARRCWTRATRSRSPRRPRRCSSTRC